MTPDSLLHLNAWVVFGIVGQLLFASRFVIQWLVSERRRVSTIPVAFWYLSLAGGMILFVYACWYRRDPVFTLGQSAGLLVYVRNLMLIRQTRAGAEAAAAQRVESAGA